MFIEPRIYCLVRQVTAAITNDRGLDGILRQETMKGENSSQAIFRHDTKLLHG